MTPRLFLAVWATAAIFCRLNLDPRRLRGTVGTGIANIFEAATTGFLLTALGFGLTLLWRWALQ